MEENIKEFLNYFEKTTLEQLFMQIESALSDKSGESQETVRSVFREVHSLKGTAGILKIELIVQFLHVYEEALGVISKNVDRIEEVLDKSIFDFFLEGLDLLETMCLSLRDHAGFVLKEHPDLLNSYVYQIVMARRIFQTPEKYLVLAELDEDLF